MPPLDLEPGMLAAAYAKNNAALIDSIAHARRVIKIWEALRDMISNPAIEVSGRLILKRKNGQRVIAVRGVADITSQFKVPTVLLDATLPDAAILKVYHPTVEVIADIDVKLPPPVFVRQILGAPTSSRKLDHKKHLADLRRYILRRWLETGRAATLVIAQEKVEKWLKLEGLPDDITVEHFNDISGIDHFKDVRLLILAGRTAPGTEAMEALAGTLSGVSPTSVSGAGFKWYDRVERGIRLADGSGIATVGDRHPDAFVEGVRWQVHEGELIQAFGRARGVNRTAETPLDIDMLFDTALPVIVNRTERWRRPGLFIEPVVEGVVLTSRVDMVKVWSHLWPNDMLAKRALKELPNELIAGWPRFSYQLVGPKMKSRVAYAVIPDLKSWLESRLGTLKVFDPL